ncbi:uncharacterized protein LOC141641753 [Silene latifolia]|uniref:uncharacterized protein LOC141641753 n=1 Tax=Silene latifolia TaxID=37657 RepID=UPI003D77EA52
MGCYTEVLSSMMRRAMESGAIHGVRVAAQAPSVTHLLFVDDSLFFTRANVAEAVRIKDILARYETASGQMVNLGKTTVSFSRGTSMVRRVAVAEVLGVRIVDVQDKYLGLPTMVSHSKKVISMVIRDKICKKLQVRLAREVLHLGIRWRIGDGASTRVWADPWIHGTQTRRVISPRTNASEDILVNELMNEEGTGWNVAKVGELFLPFEQERILRIRISDNKPVDGWCWDPERDGIYTVKSAYRLLCAANDDAPGQSNDKTEQALWNKVWKIDALPRIKIFFWQLCLDALATRANIANRLRNGADHLCPVCNGFEESCLHLVRECGWVDWVWEGVGMELKKGVGFERARNKWVFEGKVIQPDAVVRRVRGLLREMLEGQGANGGGAAGESEGHSEAGDGWVRPRVGEFKINVDAGVISGVGTGWGAVCHDEGGGVVWAVTEQEVEERDPTVAEALAVLVGVQEAKRRGMTRIVVEGDCLSVITDLQKRKQGRSDIFFIYDEIFNVCSSFENCVFSFTRRNFNSVAHTLAHIDPWLVGCRRWDEDVPHNVAVCIANDLLSMK